MKKITKRQGGDIEFARGDIFLRELKKSSPFYRKPFLTLKSEGRVLERGSEESIKAANTLRYGREYPRFVKDLEKFQRAEYVKHDMRKAKPYAIGTGALGAIGTGAYLISRKKKEEQLSSLSSLIELSRLTNYECPTCGLVQRYKIPRAHFCPNDSSLMLPVREDGTIGFSTMKKSAQILIELARGDYTKRFLEGDSAWDTNEQARAARDATLHRIAEPKEGDKAVQAIRQHFQTSQELEPGRSGALSHTIQKHWDRKGVIRKRSDAAAIISAEIDHNIGGAHQGYHDQLAEMRNEAEQKASHAEHVNGDVAHAKKIMKRHAADEEKFKRLYHDITLKKNHNRFYAAKVGDRTEKMPVEQYIQRQSGLPANQRTKLARQLEVRGTGGLSNQDVSQAIHKRGAFGKSISSELREKKDIMGALRKSTGTKIGPTGKRNAEGKLVWDEAAAKERKALNSSFLKKDASGESAAGWARGEINRAVEREQANYPARIEKLIGKLDARAEQRAQSHFTGVKGEDALTARQRADDAIGALRGKRSDIDPGFIADRVGITKSSANRLHDVRLLMEDDSTARDRMTTRKIVRSGSVLGPIPTKAETIAKENPSLKRGFARAGKSIFGTIGRAGKSTLRDVVKQVKPYVGKLKIAGGIGAGVGLLGAGAYALRDRKKQTREFSSNLRIIKFGAPNPRGVVQDFEALRAWREGERAAAGTGRAVKKGSITKKKVKVTEKKIRKAKPAKRDMNGRELPEDENIRLIQRRVRGPFSEALWKASLPESNMVTDTVEGTPIYGKSFFDAALAPKNKAGRYAPEVRKVRKIAAVRIARARTAAQATKESGKIIEGLTKKSNEDTGQISSLLDTLGHERATSGEALNSATKRHTQDIADLAETKNKRIREVRAEAAWTRRDANKRIGRAYIAAGGAGVAAGGAGGYIIGDQRKKRDEVKFAARDDRPTPIKSAVKMGASAGVSAAALTAFLSLAKGKEGLTRSHIESAIKNAGIAGGLAGSFGAGSSLVGTRVLGSPKIGEDKAYTKRGAVGGAILGTAGGLALGIASKKHKWSGNQVSKLAEEGWRPVKFLQKQGTVGRALTGAAIGGTAGSFHIADEGIAVDALLSDKKKEKKFSSKMKTIRFASKMPVAADRYRKKIAIEEDNRHEKDLLRSSVVGGAIGHLMRDHIPLKHAGAILAGIGAGAATQAGVRMITRKQKDQFGDMPLHTKKLERAPWMIGGLAAGGIMANRAYRGAKMFSRKGRIIQFGLYDDKVLDSVLRAHKEYNNDTGEWGARDDRRMTRKAEDIWRKAGRTRRLARDVGQKLQGKENVDDRGRARVPEWKKPWAQKAAGMAVLTGAAIVGGKAVRRIKAKAAVQRAEWLPYSGTEGLYNAAKDYLTIRPNPKIDMTESVSEIMAHRNKLGLGSSIRPKGFRNHRNAASVVMGAQRGIRQIKSDFHAIKEAKVEDMVNKMAGFKGTAQDTYDSVAKAKTAVEGMKTAAENKRLAEIAQIGHEKKGVIVPPLTKRESESATLKKLKKAIGGDTNLSAHGRIILFAVDPNWSLRQQYGNAVLVAPPGTQTRDRRSKAELGKETLEQERQRKRRELAVGITGAVGAGGLGTRAYYQRFTPAGIQQRAERQAKEAEVMKNYRATAKSANGVRIMKKESEQLRKIARQIR